MVFATVLWASRCARYEAMIASAQAADDEARATATDPAAPMPVRGARS
ncbi:hypothetical protein [Microbacterium thalli]|uniref:Uncharacterized protein n=1 Tax=Microbacterium thalli TaxID=3027921 RepID=A0ABT5SDT7_9MICO|nr:hypothetical protein [Microbacterium thalli]MDD7928386.1 hypothetical protein [Microbacterium thalli]MDD7960967.1 hypothetical protein [Microbacterium thalli]MDN8549774.1 hypothetical protein [Microbacterium thalli]